jgi:glucans biosynthesis protein
MYWCTHTPVAPTLAQAVATRTSLGGAVGSERRYFSWRFAVDFAGAGVAALGQDARVESVISVSRGTIETPAAHRLAIDPRAPCHIQSDAARGKRGADRYPTVPPVPGQPLTETWSYLWTPPSVQERRSA